MEKEIEIRAKENDSNVTHNTQVFTFEVSYQMTFRGPSTMVLDDSSTAPAVSKYVKMVQASGSSVPRLSIAKMRGVAKR